MKWITYVRGIIPIYRIFPVLEGCVDKIQVVFYNDGKKLIFAWNKEQLEEKSKEINLELAKELEKRLFEADKIAEKYKDNNSPEMIKEFFDKIVNTLSDANIYIDAFDEFPCTLDEPRYSSYMARLHNELYDLKQDYSEKKLDEIYSKYWWTSLGWENLVPDSKEDFKKRLENIKEKVEIVSTGDDLASIFAELHDLRKEVQIKISFVLRQMLKTLSEKRNIPIEDMEWAMPKEVFDIDHEILIKRKNLMYYDGDGKISIYYDDEAVEFGEQVLPFDKKDSVEGKCAYQGSVKGKARVCRGVHEARNIKEDEILITGMTMPDYVPYMKKALAVVTNEGGLTCHAGIISREFKIPCVVGTVHATEIFKTGDMIEVDANKGVVRKI